MAGVVLITGGSRGIGAETSRLLASRGWQIGVNYSRGASEAQALADEISQTGGKAMALQGDVSQEADVIRLFDSLEQSFGPVTALVNNAGILLPQMKLAEMSVDRINKVFSVNVTGAFLCAREAVNRMAVSRGGAGGAIVNISSIAAKLGAPCEYIDYAASKGAIDSMTVGLAKEVAQESIRVNAVRPGIIDTEIHASGGEPDRIHRVSPSIPLQRAGEPLEVAEAILWLLSDASSYVTGALLDVSGGR